MEWYNISAVGNYTRCWNAKFNGNLIVGTGSTYGVLDIKFLLVSATMYQVKNSTVGVANGLLMLSKCYHRKVKTDVSLKTQYQQAY
jgi:hypothetical protein